VDGGVGDEEAGDAGEGIRSDAKGGCSGKEGAALLLEAIEGGLRRDLRGSRGGSLAFGAAEEHCGSLPYGSGRFKRMFLLLG
jgi:hypothetical protein